MKISKKLVLFVPLLFMTGISVALVMSGLDYSISNSGTNSLASSAKPSAGDYTIDSSAVLGVGAIFMSGGGYTLTGGAGGLIGGASGTTYLKTDLSEVIVFPNPYKPGSGTQFDASEITFRNLTQNIEVKIFNIAGNLVRTLESDSTTGEAVWDAMNDSGEKVASGVYIYIMVDKDDSSQMAKGKFAIIK